MEVRFGGMGSGGVALAVADGDRRSEAARR